MDSECRTEARASREEQGGCQQQSVFMSDTPLPRSQSYSPEQLAEAIADYMAILQTWENKDTGEVSCYAQEELIQ